jgi:predicted GIY-YIG superfamily endonuclease
MSYFTYILQSEIDQSFYIGYTANIHNRLETFEFRREVIIREKEPK